MARRPLRTGFTTGACAAASALGAARMLKEQRLIEEVTLFLPAGIAATFRLHGQRFDAASASCFVVKDAGDDPDVTNGCEVWAEILLLPPGEGGAAVVIEGGTGIGKATKPGLAVPVGEWAINPVPRRMIEEAVRTVFPPHASPFTPQVTIGIPDGEERAKRTLNERLGIVGGLSILGTTGIVRPISHQAWTDTLDAALEVALAGGSDTVVLSTGRTSELAAEKILRQRGLPDEAFIMMGDHIGYALEACHRRGFAEIILAAQFAKLFKIACGHRQTHVGASRLELEQLASWCRACGLDDSLVKTIECANTAREVYLAAADRSALAAVVAQRALEQLRSLAPGAAVSVLLIDYGGAAAECYGECSTKGKTS